MSELDKIFEPFSQQSGNKGITLTWSTKDSISQAKKDIKALIAQQVLKELERLKLETDANICDCGAEWKDTDLADLIDTRINHWKNSL